MHALMQRAGPGNAAQARRPPPGLTSPSAAGGTSPVLTVFQAASSCCVGPGRSAAAISTHQHPEPLGAARGDDAQLRLARAQR